MASVKFPVTSSGLPKNALEAHMGWLDYTHSPEFRVQEKYLTACRAAEAIKEFFQRVWSLYHDDMSLASSEPFSRSVPTELDDTEKAPEILATFLGDLYQSLFDIIYVPEQVQVPNCILDAFDEILSPT